MDPWTGVDTWQDLPGFTTGMLIVGCGFAFLLVFRINWSFNRWWDSRSSVGLNTTLLRDLCANVSSGSFQPTVVGGGLSSFQPSEEHDRLALNELRARNKIVEHDNCQRDVKRKEKQKAALAVTLETGRTPRTAKKTPRGGGTSRMPKDLGMVTAEELDRSPFLEVCCQDVYWAAKGWFGTLVDILKGREDMESYEHHLDSSMLRYGRMLTRAFQQSARPACPPGPRLPPKGEHRTQKIMIAHSLLCSAVRRAFEAQLLSGPEYQKALNQLQDILASAYNLLKVKSEPVPSSMTKVTLFLLLLYTILFPIYSAYFFVTQLSAEALAGNYGLKPFPVFMYFLSTMLVLLFFSVLRFISQQMDSPFNDEPFDIKLVKMRMNLWGDIDTMDTAFASIYKYEQNHPNNIFLFNALKDNHVKTVKQDEYVPQSSLI
eukprot:CAMPEP_0196587896 /NCGR_PEP_ID=MMETSP1081-20130531/58946_1 /TAXON_ID=36882 /ORGANISM="Pyramimonas amylifera, Strain CCMP720" /LENGTH=430 /DNA_ID=CAMNT_0041910227 /DNA_START=93 /DNA_END=1385 /DNA_ORIENTATION=-